MELLRGDDRLPRYQRLADALRNDVVNRRWQLGVRLPSETAIAEDFGVATGTVRQALSLLVEEGLLERQHGKGTFIRRPNFDRSLFRFFRFQSASGERVIPESRILNRRIESPPEHVSKTLQLRKNAQAITISRLRLVEGTPVLAEEIWLPLKPFRKFMELDDREIGPLLYPIYDVVCEQVVARADETLTAEAAQPEHSRLLQLEQGAPIIMIDRLARGYDNKPIEWRRSRGPASQFRYFTEIH